MWVRSECIASAPFWKSLKQWPFHVKSFHLSLALTLCASCNYYKPVSWTINLTWWCFQRVTKYTSVSFFFLLLLHKLTGQPNLKVGTWPFWWSDSVSRVTEGWSVVIACVNGFHWIWCNVLINLTTHPMCLYSVFCIIYQWVSLF